MDLFIKLQVLSASQLKLLLEQKLETQQSLGNVAFVPSESQKLSEFKDDFFFFFFSFKESLFLTLCVWALYVLVSFFFMGYALHGVVRFYLWYQRGQYISAIYEVKTPVWQN